MLFYLTAIFCCQLVGELAVGALALPIPGPVVGMALLFLSLAVLREIPAELAKIADALLGNLALCFVPAGVGVMLHFRLIGDDWLAISVGLLASTVVAMALTGLAMQWFAPATDAQPRHDVR